MLPRSDSISTFSTTGETMYEDAQQFDTPAASIEQELAPENTENAPITEQSQITSEKSQEIKDTQPLETPPPTYSKQKRGYQPEESQCKTFLCNNWFQVLDLPDLRSGCCLCCNTCCAACFSSGVNRAGAIR